MRALRLIAAAWGLLLTGCAAAPGAASEATGLTVFAASSLTEAFSEIGAGYREGHPDVALTFSFGGSQALRTQIEAGAQADVFAAASSREMDGLVAGGMVQAATPQVFLTNKLVVLLPAANPAGVLQLQDLVKPGLKLVLAAQEVPVGNYARQSLEKMNAEFGADFGERVLANVVSNEDNVRQVVAKVQLGEADAGIAYTSDAVAVRELKTIEIPADLNVIATYPIAPLMGSAHPDQAADFIEYVLSPVGQAILREWGFAPPGQ